MLDARALRGGSIDGGGGIFGLVSASVFYSLRPDAQCIGDTDCTTQKGECCGFDVTDDANLFQCNASNCNAAFVLPGSTDGPGGSSAQALRPLFVTVALSVVFAVLAAVW
jgi:hypothetical protein